MANTWGTTPLKILVGSAKLGASAPSLTEIPLLPDPLALNAITTVIQQQGRKRRRVNARLYVPTMTEYYAYRTDMDDGVSRALIIEITSTLGTYMIESLGEPEYIPHDMIFFDITWVEMGV